MLQRCQSPWRFLQKGNKVFCLSFWRRSFSPFLDPQMMNSMGGDDLPELDGIADEVRFTAHGFVRGSLSLIDEKVTFTLKITIF